MLLSQTVAVPVDATLSEDDFRLFYAAYDNDVLLMQSLNILGWHVSLSTRLHTPTISARAHCAHSFCSGKYCRLRWSHSSRCCRITRQCRGRTLSPSSRRKLFNQRHPVMLTGSRSAAQYFADDHCSGNTPIDDAKREKRDGVIKIFGETQKSVIRALSWSHLHGRSICSKVEVRFGQRTVNFF